MCVCVYVCMCIYIYICSVYVYIDNNNNSNSNRNSNSNSTDSRRVRPVSVLRFCRFQNCLHFSMCACHPWTGAMPIFILIVHRFNFSFL